MCTVGMVIYIGKSVFQTVVAAVVTVVVTICETVAVAVCYITVCKAITWSNSREGW